MDPMKIILGMDLIPNIFIENKQENDTLEALIREEKSEIYVSQNFICFHIENDALWPR